ncbi:MAG: hypothetical protein MZV63_21840 [Marinilabiliales bacterium]|nr:hypothetical protein [Marinilabiliales bacterium]
MSREASGSVTSRYFVPGFGTRRFSGLGIGFSTAGIVEKIFLMLAFNSVNVNITNHGYGLKIGAVPVVIKMPAMYQDEKFLITSGISDYISDSIL